MPEPLRLKDNITEYQIFTKRILLAVLFMLVLMCVLLSRYFHLQVLEHAAYQTKSDQNRVHVISVAPKRGLIFDRNGQLLAENQPSYTLTLVKETVDDLDSTLDLLKELIELRQVDLDRFKRRQRLRRPFEAVPLKFRLEEKEIAVLAVNAYRLPGVEVSAQLVRHYPYGELFAHAVGYVGRINDREQIDIDAVNYSATHHIGKTGLERYYEDVLHGQVGYQNVETNARGKVLRVLDEIAPVPGQDLTLSIDLHTQQVAFDALKEERGAVVALDPNTGAVLAIVSTPSFDPNLFVNGISSKDYTRLRESLDLPLFNRTMQGQYPPGSTLKPMFGLAGLHYDVVTPETLVADPGWYRLPGEERMFRDWKKGGHADYVDLYMAIQQSCDIYYYDLAFKLGIDRLSSYSEGFGLGKRTDVDQTSERSGLLPSREWKRIYKRSHWFPGETLNAGIGQGFMLTTPMQLAQATAVLAARGDMYRPRLLHKQGDTTLEPEFLGHTVEANDEHWDYIFKAMEAVVHSRRGTANRVSKGIKYRMAGKTGTAQVIGIAQDEEYDAEKIAKRKRDHALFVGFAPAEKPLIAVAVVVENGEHGSSAAAPVARKVMDAYLLPLFERIKMEQIKAKKIEEQQIQNSKAQAQAESAGVSTDDVGNKHVSNDDSSNNKVVNNKVMRGIG
jgi:penicillin-binding protein 2